MLITGTVSRILSAPPSGGAIFNLKLDAASRKIRVKADHSVMRDAPEVGERLSFNGSFVVGIHGEQFIPLLALPELPSTSSVVDLLLHHPKFLFVGTRRIRNVCRKLGDGLITALDDGNIILLESAGARDLAALRLVDAWNDYRTGVDASRFLLERGIGPMTTSSAVRLWGKATLKVVGVNPYVLTAVAGWAEIDDAALRHFGVQPQCLRRALGCCAAICNEGLSRGAAAIPLNAFKKTFHQRMGDYFTAGDALAACQEGQGVAILQSESGTYVQGLGMTAIEANIRHSLSAICTEPASVGKPGRDEIQRPASRSELDLLETLAGSTLATIEARGAQALIVGNRVAQWFPKAVHISLTTAVLSRLSQPRLDSYLLRQFVQDTHQPPDITGKTVIVHDSSAIDLLLANKLLRNIASARRIVFIGDQELSLTSGPGNIFASLIRSRAITHLVGLELARTGLSTTPLISLPQELPRRAAGFDAPIRGLRFIEANKASELAVLATNAYREVEDDLSEGVVIASSAELALLINSGVHEELCDYLVSTGQEKSLLKLRQKQEATIGDVVTFHERDYNRGLFRGSRGIILRVFPPGRYQRKKATTAVARVRFDTAGDIDITLQDCQCMSLGHAIQVQQASLSRWSTTIMVIEENKNATYSWCWRAMSKATQKLVVVSQNGALQAALARRTPDSAYVANLDAMAT